MRRKKFSYCFLTLFILIFPVVSFAAKKFNWLCKSDINCNLYANLNSGKKMVVSKDISKDLADKFVFEYYANNIAAAIIGCGNSCNYTFFVDLQSGKITDPLYDVFAVNAVKKIIALAGADGNTLDIIPIFNSHKKAIKIKRDFWWSTDISIRKAKFIDNGLYILYDTSEDTSREEIVPIDYKKLQ